MLKKFYHLTEIFETNLSAAEWTWRIFTFLVVVGGGTTAGLLARGTELFSAAGPIGWFTIAIGSAILFSTIFFLVNASRRQSAEATYMQALSQPKSRVNPLAESFSDQVIYLPDLYLPRRQVHTNKQFKRCKIVGPAAIAMLGG